MARCSVDYVGRLTAHLPMAPRLLLVKADGSVSIHADDRAYKPLNWMSPPCSLREEGDRVDGHQQGRRAADHHDRARCCTTPRTSSAPTPAWSRTASRPTCSGCWPSRSTPSAPATGWSAGSTRPRSARSTSSAGTPAAASVAVEIKRRGEIDGVEQLTRYLELINRDPVLAPVRGIFAAQAITPQARVLAADRGIACVTLDYDALRGVDDPSSRLF